MPCEAWCNTFTCLQPPCLSCGPPLCSVAKYGVRHDDSTSEPSSQARVHCAAWCISYTCKQAECLDCGLANGCDGREPPSPPSPPPIPRLPPVSSLNAQSVSQPANYFTYGSDIFTNALHAAGGSDNYTRLRIRGAAWFGMESKSCVIGGAAQQAIEVSADWLKSNGFNAVRLPLAADAILQPRTHPCLSLGDRAQVRMHNLALGSLDYVEQVQEIARTLAEAGVLLLLDMHVLEAGKWPDGGAVGGAGITTLRAAWERLADALCDAEDYWNVMGADLKNEPYTMAWNTWSRLASDIGSAIHAKCSRWLLFVQGVGDCAGPQRDDGKPCAHLAAGASHDATLRGGIWWGENLQAARVAPVDVGYSGPLGKVVYSPHTYGPATHWQRQFDDEHFPKNMPHIWDTLWAYLARLQVAPVVVGEFGGLAVGSDAVLQQALASFMASGAIAGGFYWSLNPESADTGGLIDHWGSMKPNPTKLDIVSHLPSTPVPRKSERQPTPPPSSYGASPQVSSGLQFHPPFPPPVPPLLPPPPAPPPPPYLLEVKLVGGSSRETVPPSAIHAPQVRAVQPSWRIAASPPLPTYRSSQSVSDVRFGEVIDASTSHGDATPPPNEVWLIPGLVLNGWAGLAQLIMLLIGLALARKLLCGLDEEIASTAGGDGERRDEGLTRKMHRSQGKRWQRVETAAVADGEASVSAGGEIEELT